MLDKGLPKDENSKSIDVFISFSSKDINAARFICQKLEAQGFKCWLADRNRNDIPPGRNWAGQLMLALKNSKMVLLIFSRDSNVSRHVQNEIGVAFNHEVGILPMRIQEEQPEDILEYYLVHTQWFDVIPPPPPIETGKLNRLIEVIKLLLNEKQQLKQNQETQSSRIKKAPFFSTWVLLPSAIWFRKLCESVSALEGALWTYLVMFLVFFIPLAISHRIVGTYPPETFAELFQAASGFHFYYPDLNAILFDIILHPAAFAALVYFILFISAHENQYLLETAVVFIPTRNIRLARLWINIANLLIVKILPIGMAAWSFFYRKNIYLGYGMKEPLVFWASLAVAMSIYVFVALSINTSYIALLIKPIRSIEMQTDDDKAFSSEQAGMLAKLTVIFIYVILMCLIEIAVEWFMADFNGTVFFDLMRWIIAVFGGLAILILSAKILWLWTPEIGYHRESIKNAFRQVGMSNWLLLVLPAILIILTIKLWLQVY